VNYTMAQEEEPSTTTPVTIITGFLGAGKTTLLRHVLTEPHGLKIAVVQNEMSAAVGLEEATVRGPNGEEFAEWMELANGCVCCAVRDDLVQCMEKLVERRSFDYILIETTGMADPGPVAASFWLDDELESPLKLDGIVTVVDCHNLSKQLSTMEACRQISSADCILLNKSDGLEPTHLAELHAHVRHLNPAAPVLPTSHSKVPVASILNLNAFDSKARGATECAWAFDPKAGARSARSGAPTSLRAPSVTDGSAGDERGDERGDEGGDERDFSLCGECDEDQAPPSSVTRAPVLRWLHKDAAFGQITLVELGTLQLEPLERALAAIFFEPEQLAHERGLLGTADGEAVAAEEEAALPEIYRAKGIFDVEGSACMYALQAVQSTYELVEGPLWGDGSQRQSRVTFIGRDLPSEEALRTALVACRAAPAKEHEKAG